jgi:serine/threonine protein phosphatase 1
MIKQHTASPHIQKIPENKAGRDFVLGDLHGCMPSFLKLLEKIKFNKEKDRIISVGDLPHRGPDSLGCLSLLQEPWFHCVRGNHEEDTIAALNTHFGLPSKNHDAFYKLATDGGLWLCELVAKAVSTSKKAPLINQALSAALVNMQALPKILIVGEGKSRYHVVHHFLLKDDSHKPTDSNFKKTCSLSSKEIDEIALGKKILEKPWLLNESKHVGSHVKTIKQEKRPENHWDESQLWEGEPLTFCGHTPLKDPMVFLNHFHVDTGAGKPDKEDMIRKLSMVDIKTGEIFQERAGYPELKISPKDYAKEVGQAIQKGKEPPTLKELS